MSGPAADAVADIRIVRGTPDEYELAALTVALLVAARREQAPSEDEPARATWDPPAYDPPGAWTEGPGNP